MSDDEKGLATQETVEYISRDSRVSQFYEREPRARVHVEVAGRTHPGKVRENNEDNYLAVRRYRGRNVLATSLPEESLVSTEDCAYTLAVADGMGGGNFGELASLIATRTGWELGGGEIKWPMKINDREAEELRQKAETLFDLIDEALQAAVRESPRLAGMATTLTACYSMGLELFVMHAGDSRAYLYRRGVLKQLTRDHNLAQLLVDSGVTEPDSTLAKKMRHVLTNVLGGPPDKVIVDVYHDRLLDDDRVLLCTDGLSNMVPDEEIARILGHKPVPAEACAALVDLALENGGKDNVTVLVGHYQIQERC
jgi:serine/threonine protein phosphatase PrpC